VIGNKSKKKTNIIQKSIYLPPDLSGGTLVGMILESRIDGWRLLHTV